MRFQKLIVLIEKHLFVMERELMEFQMLVVHHPFQCAMDYQELMDIQELIVLHHLFQLVDSNMVVNQELIVKLEDLMNYQHQLVHQLWLN